MADSTVTVTALMSFLDPDSGVTPPDQLGIRDASFGGSEHKYTKNLMTVPVTSGGIAIPLGAVNSPGDSLFINRDTSNFIIIYDQVGGTKIAQLDPGKAMLIPFDPSITAPAAEADTGSCQMSYMIIERGDISPLP